MVAEPADTTVGQQKNRELENVVGNLLVAEYQEDRIKQRMVDKFTWWYDAKGIKDNRSTFVFWFNEKWYKVSLEVESQQRKNNSENSDAFTELGCDMD